MRLYLLTLSPVSSSPSVLQSESPSLQAGVQVNDEQEKLVLNALMLYQPADLYQLSGGSLAQSGNSAAWGDGLRTEWVTECSSLTNKHRQEHHIQHRLYVQAAPGEMRLATTMITETE